MPTAVRRSLVKLGQGVNVARRRRAMTTARVAEAAGISLGTLRRIEKGDPSVSLGAIAMVLLSLGELARLDALLPPNTDHMGLALDLNRLPKRISQRSKGGSGL